MRHIHYVFFFFNDTATTEIYTLSLHDALPICSARAENLLDVGQADGHGQIPRLPHEETHQEVEVPLLADPRQAAEARRSGDRKSTRLNSSHANISYAVFCLKKKKKQSV